MQLAKSLLVASFLVATSFATTVTYSQPSTSTAVSPLKVSASATGYSRLLQLYIDGKKITETHADVLTASVPLAPGSHRVAVQSLNYSWQVNAKTVKYITIAAAPAQKPPTPTPVPPTPAPTPTPVPPVVAPTGTVLSNVQESSNWETCGACGNTGATGKVATYSMTRGLTTPAMDGTSTSAEFSIGGPYPYSNGYWWIYHNGNAPTAPIKNLVYDFYLYIPAASANAPQAIEFECQHVVDGYVYNYAWQAEYAQHVWRTFDYVNKVWIATSVPFTAFAPDTWHHIVAESHGEGTNTVHDAITVDGVRTVVNIVRPAKPTTQTTPSLSNAFQLDLNSVPTAYTVYVDKMTVSYE